MEKWADYLISEVSYDSEHLIYVAIRHEDTEHGITEGKPIDRLTIASDIKNGLFYITIYSGKDSWKKGHKIQTFSIDGNPYLRIDNNKVKLDYLGDLPESLIVKSENIKELELKQPETESPSSPRGSLPKESTEELSQELDLAPEVTTEQEEFIPEQLTKLEQLEKQIQELESEKSISIEEPEGEATPEQLTKLEQLEKQIQELESQPPPKVERSTEQLDKLEQLEKQIQDLVSQQPESPPPSSPRGSLPKESTKELSQELDLAPEPIEEPEDEDATPEQLRRLEQLEKQIQELESPPPSSPRGSLPKESTKELSQELDLAPEPIEEPEDEDATPEQLTQVNDLQEQIDELEEMLSSQISPESSPEDEEATPEQLTQVNDLQEQIDELEDVLSTMLHPSSDEPTAEQISKVKELEKEIERLEAVDIEHEIIQTLRKQNEKLDDIEKKIHDSTEQKNSESDMPEAYCVKCKTKRKIENPKDTTMKNGRPAIKGTCSVCHCKVFRVVKMKK